MTLSPTVFETSSSESSIVADDFLLDRVFCDGQSKFSVAARPRTRRTATHWLVGLRSRRRGRSIGFLFLGAILVDELGDLADGFIPRRVGVVLFGVGIEQRMEQGAGGEDRLPFGVVLVFQKIGNKGEDACLQKEEK